MTADILGQDFNGSPIAVGDVLVYPTRRGAAMWLSSGKALGYDNLTGSVRIRVETRTADNERRIVYIDPKRCTVQVNGNELREVVKGFVRASVKFIGKVSRGEAQSVETFNDLSEGVERARVAGVGA